MRADCPTSTQFYVCSLNHFQGCCSTDPCNVAAGCPDGGTLYSSTILPLSSSIALASSAWAVPLSTKTSTGAIWTPASTNLSGTSTPASGASSGPPVTSILGFSVALGALGLLVLALISWILRKAFVRLLHCQHRTKDVKAQWRYSASVFELDANSLHDCEGQRKEELA